MSKLAAYLEAVARKGRPIHYGELVKAFNLPPMDGAWTSHPLCAAFDRLDRDDAEANRPFRTSVVTAKDLSRPGDGFFKSLFELKHISAKSENQKLEVFLREFEAATKYPWSEKS